MDPSDRDARLVALYETHARDILFYWRLSPRSGLEYVSPSVLAVTGYTAGECLADPAIWARLVEPEDRAAAATVMEAARSGQPLRLRWVCKDGRAIQVELRHEAVTDDEGRIVALEGAVADVTEPTRAQAVHEATFAMAEAAANAQHLPELYARIHGIVGSLIDARNFYIALFDDRDRTVSISYFVDEHAVTPTPFRGMTRRPLGRGMTEYVLRTGVPLLASSADLDLLSQQGEIAPRKAPGALSWAGAPLRTGERIMGMMAVQSYRPDVSYSAEDLELLVFVSRLVALAITRRMAADEIAERATALERSNQELEHFAYVASHDLQEPLRAIAGFLQLVEKRSGDKLDQRSHEYMARSIAAATRMQRMIHDLLEYARVTTRGEAFIEVDSAEALRQALDSLSAAIAESGIRIECEPLPTVIADQGQLARVFQNLVGNAAKFRTGAPQVRIWAEERETEWLFSVQDNGIGIAPEHRERVFRVFQRLHERDRYPGSGIGLAICQRVVERHGGRIWVDAAPERGSIFRFTLPRRGGGST